MYYEYSIFFVRVVIFVAPKMVHKTQAASLEGLSFQYCNTIFHSTKDVFRTLFWTNNMNLQLAISNEQNVVVFFHTILLFFAAFC